MSEAEISRYLRGDVPTPCVSVPEGEWPVVVLRSAEEVRATFIKIRYAPGCQNLF